jgi:hypothetical protein
MKDYQRRALRSAALAAYEQFARQHPEWAASLFDEHFVLAQALPMLEQAAGSGRQVSPGALAAAWSYQMGCTAELRRRHQAAATAVAAHYLALVAQALGMGYYGRTWLGQPDLHAVG